MVASTSLSPGAEMITRFAPAAMCAEAFALLVKRPVHSRTTSTPSSFHGSCDGSLLRADPDLVAVDDEVLAFDLDRAGEAPVRGVVLREMGVGRGVAEVVDGDDREIVPLPALVVRAEDHAADAAVPVDGDANGHRLLLSKNRYERTRLTAATTLSTVNPKCLNSSGPGADSPNRSMPITAPCPLSAAPTYLRQ